MLSSGDFVIIVGSLNNPVARAFGSQAVINLGYPFRWFVESLNIVSGSFYDSVIIAESEKRIHSLMQSFFSE